jgi:acyl carrier protein
MDNLIKLNQLIAEVLDLKIEEINDDVSPENTDSWDSFNALVMVTELEETFNVSFTMDEVYEVKKVSDIKEILTQHSVSFD